jgi:CO/xanthine dehydrogenase Mo-binding subunit
MTDQQEFSVVGKGFAVKDGAEKVAGSLQYAVDFGVYRMAFGKILRSPYAHARIISIDTSKAEALPGVLAVLTHHDTPRNHWEAAWFNYRGMVLDGTARFVGDEVAAVAADTPDTAERAVELIDVEWEVLPHVFDIEEARQPDAPQVREEGNVRPPMVSYWGDLAQGERDADFTVACDITFPSQQFAPLGRNACIAEWSNDKVTVWTSSQTPSELKDGIHEALGIPQNKIRVQAMPSGSSFGQWWSNNFMLVTVLLAKKAGRAVKIELDNEECMATVKRRHEERSRGRMGCSRDGQITFLEMDHLIDNGAYGYKDDVGYTVDLWNEIQNAHITVTGINTNRLTAGCMRGVGDVTVSSAHERMADMLAEKAGIDPIEFRLKNQINPGDPFRSVKRDPTIDTQGDGAKIVAKLPPRLRDSWPKLYHLSSGSPRAMLVDGAERFRWKERFAGLGKPGSINRSKRRAVGVGTGCHVCGVELEGNSSAIVRLNPDGSAKVFCSVGRQGQGSETTQAQVAAEALGLPLDRVETETGDTDACPWNHGSIASNTMFRTGWATREAAIDARTQLLALAAKECFDDIDPENLSITEGMIHLASEPRSNRGVSFSEVLNLIRSDAGGQISSITGQPRDPMPPSLSFARQYAVQFVEVEVDTDTGQIKILDYLALQDSGTVVNPQVLKNQVIGGVICGLGYALYEELKFDPETGAVLNGNLLDYKLLRTADFPPHAEVVFHESRDPVGPYGARGAGESPIAAAIPAASQAVYNAIGVWVDIPMTPEKVIRALGKI